MDFGLNERCALVTGSTQGLGRGIAEALAAEGAQVIITGRETARAQAVARELNGGAVGYGLDLGDTASVAATLAALQREVGALDVLVLNSGGPPPGPVVSVTAETWASQFQAMMLSFFQIVAAVLPGMRERRWGRILISSSSGAVQPQAHLGISNTLRAGLLGWVKSLSNEVAGDGVTVNTLVPGRIQTRRLDQIDATAARATGRTVQEVVQASHEAIPAGRYGTPAEYGAVAAFLVSQQASYITGAAIPVDGGFVRGL